MAYWLMKSEPSVFSIDDLKHAPKGVEHWDGVRNYQARNMMRDQMKRGDQAFFYHSSCSLPGIVGVVEIIREGYPDFTAHDPGSPYFDPSSNENEPRWYMVDVRYLRSLRRVISLAELKQHVQLEDLALLRRGNRLSIMPITSKQWQYILRLE